MRVKKREGTWRSPLRPGRDRLCIRSGLEKSAFLRWQARA